MRILGIDPGISVTGWGVVEAEGDSLRHLDAGTIHPARSEGFPGALKKIYEGLEEVIKRYSPQEAAVENIFYAKNARAALVLGHARGAALLSIANAGLELHEYTPLEIKKALVGYGGAGKEQVKVMVKSLLHLTGDCEDHSSDALAVAICHIHSSNFRKKISGCSSGA